MITDDPTGVERLLELRGDLARPADPGADRGRRRRSSSGSPPRSWSTAPASACSPATSTPSSRGHAGPRARPTRRRTAPRRAPTALLGLGHWTTGDLVTAEAQLRRAAVAGFTASDHLPDMLGCSLALADIQIAPGPAGRRPPHLRGRAPVHGRAPGAAGHRRHARRAQRGPARAQRPRRRAGAPRREPRASASRPALPQHPYRWRVTMARLRRADGDLDGALALLDEAEPALRHRLLAAASGRSPRSGRGCSSPAATSRRRARWAEDAGSAPTTS